MTNQKPANNKLEFYGGVPILLVPFTVMFIGILWLGFTGAALPEAFWPMALLALLVGLLLAKNKKTYIDALIHGITSRMLAIMLLAWFLAGIMAQLLRSTDLVEGLVWGFLQTGFSIAWFPLLAFLVAALMSMSTGTSVGTLIAASPILFPVGYTLGGDPLLIIGAIIGGSYVGDNLAPISDTTIVSAYSQGTEVNKVVRSRFKYAVAAGTITIVLYIIFALLQSGSSTVEPPGDINPLGLIMLLVPALLLFLMIKGRDLVEGLLYSNAFGIILGLAANLIGFNDILVINRVEFTAGGIILDGVYGMVGVAVFTIFLMGLIGTLQLGGFLNWLIEKAELVATTPKRAEIVIVISTLMLNALTTAGTPSMVMLGDFVRRLGHKFRIQSWRRGNLMDVCSTSIIGFLPYSVGLLIPFAFVGGMVDTSIYPNFNPVGVAPYVFYCIAMVIVIVFAAFSSWGLETMNDEEYLAENKEIYGDERETHSLSQKVN
ncbi:sodium:proton antiporter [Lentibacillus populi]|uniref:Sodium:proton antiporter n=1 Tax=Lentibacillus populi TaxID=1827502 RepID=A0A9W5U1D3_9BACI|nr:Na+/H+ antiporter NhaC family protein [Lentibacillus populi]GGB57887.1 sodium:proton antiporter [Lentibacillus populi]